VFDWDQNNLRKIRAPRIQAEEVEQALARDPVLVYEQDADGHARYVYHGETEGASRRNATTRFECLWLTT